MYPRFRRSLHPSKYMSPVELLYRPSRSVAEQTQPSFAWEPGLSVPVVYPPLPERVLVPHVSLLVEVVSSCVRTHQTED